MNRDPSKMRSLELKAVILLKVKNCPPRVNKHFAKRNSLVFIIRFKDQFFIVFICNYCFLSSMSAQNANSRNRKKPIRYGESVFNLSSDSDVEEPFSADCSFYEPNNESHHEASVSSEEVDLVADINFNDEFDKIHELSNGMGSQSIQKSKQNRENTALNENVDSDPSEPSQSKKSDFQSKVLEKLQLLSDNSTQILTRISIIEDSLLKNGTLVSLNVDDKLSDYFHSFAKSNNLPVRTIESFDQFEKSLNDTSMEEAVC